MIKLNQSYTALTQWHKDARQEKSSPDSPPAGGPAALHSCRSPHWASQSRPRTSAHDQWSSCKCSPDRRGTSRAQIWRGKSTLCVYMFMWLTMTAMWGRERDMGKFTNLKPDLGFLASATHRRSMLQASTGMWGYCRVVTAFPGFPLVRRTSTISWRFVSHLIGSPNRITARGRGGIDYWGLEKIWK